jgi:hypothetical protein
MAPRLVVSLIAGLVSLPALAQERIPQSFLEELARDLAAVQQTEQPPTSPSVRVVNDGTKVYAGAATDTEPIASLETGAHAQVINNVGDWYGVLLPDKSVGWVQTRDVAPLPDTWPAQYLGPPKLDLSSAQPGWFEAQVLSLLERAAAFRQAYANNPYVTVRGFDIGLSLTGPTLGMSFEFKD